MKKLLLKSNNVFLCAPKLIKWSKCALYSFDSGSIECEFYSFQTKTIRNVEENFTELFPVFVCTSLFTFWAKIYFQVYKCMIKIFQGGRGGDTFETPSPY